MAEPSASTISNCLLLGGVGDALGGPLEFINAELIEQRYGLNPPDSLAFSGPAPAYITDDTQLTLFMAEGLNRLIAEGGAEERETFRAEIGRSLIHWLATQDSAVMSRLEDRESAYLQLDELHARRAPGMTCLASCSHIFSGGALPDVARRINHSKGCGAVMRSAPFGLMASSAAQAFGWGRDAGVLTHCHPSGYLSAAYFAALIYGVARQQSFEEAMGAADALLAQEEEAAETQAAVQRARVTLQDGDLSFESFVALGEGWVAEEALSMAIAVAMSADLSSEAGVKRALWFSVRHSGDSDSTGAMAGNLIGAICPPGSMPQDWLADLQLKEVIEAALRPRQDP